VDWNDGAVDPALIVASLAMAVSVGSWTATLWQAHSASRQADSAETQVKLARKQAEAAREQADSAREQAEAAKGQLRLEREHRAQEVARARMEQSQSIFIKHPVPLGGYASGDINGTRYELFLHNRSAGVIADVLVTLTVDTGDGTGLQTRELASPRILPEEARTQQFQIEAPREYPYRSWTAWAEAEFTDALGQRWLIDRDDRRRVIS